MIIHVGKITLFGSNINLRNLETLDFWKLSIFQYSQYNNLQSVCEVQNFWSVRSVPIPISKNTFIVL